MNEKEALSWAKRARSLAIVIAVYTFIVSILLAVAGADSNSSKLLIIVIALALIMGLLYWILGNLVYSRKNIYAAEVLFIITLFDTIWKVATLKVIPALIYIACTYIFYKGMKGVKFLKSQNELR